MAGLRVHFVFPAGLVERVDAALTVGQSRGEFVRAAVEQALGHSPVAPVTRSEVAPPAPAPAEQPRDEWPSGYEDRVAKIDGILKGATEAISPVGRSRSSSQAKRDVRPVPKAGEK